jgi:hypothetical protein
LELRVSTPSNAHNAAGRLDEWTGCRFFVPGEAEPMAPKRCLLSGIERTLLNASELVIDVPVPADYTCEELGSGCWAFLQLEYGNLPNDTTTITAELLEGDHPPPPPTQEPAAREPAAPEPPGKPAAAPAEPPIDGGAR